MRHLFLASVLFSVLNVDARDTIRITVTGTIPTTAEQGAAAAKAKGVLPTPSISNIDWLTVMLHVPLEAYKTAGSSDAGFRLTAYDTENKPVPIRQVRAGGGGGERSANVTFMVQIPIEDDERRRQLAEIVDAAITEVTDPILKDELSKKREEAISALEHYFLQNRVGEFTIRATLGDPTNPLAVGEAKFVIPDHGTFAAKLKASMKQTQ